MPVEAPADALTEVAIDLSKVMDGDFGHFIVVVAPPKGLFQPQEYWRILHTWVQVTQIGLDAFVDHSEMVAWSTTLKDGAPLADVTVTAQSGGWQAVTGEDGTARFAIPNGTTYLVAARRRPALMPHSLYLDEEA
jgi:uncharacterized protein YfaS (alpha-2-macroglobulin family)